MFNKAVDNYHHALEFVPEYYKTQKMSEKAVDTYPSTIKSDPECYNKAVNRCFFVFYSVSD